MIDADIIDLLCKSRTFIDIQYNFIYVSIGWKNICRRIKQRICTRAFICLSPRATWQERVCVCWYMYDVLQDVWYAYDAAFVSCACKDSMIRRAEPAYLCVSYFSVTNRLLRIVIRRYYQSPGLMRLCQLLIRLILAQHFRFPCQNGTFYMFMQAIVINLWASWKTNVSPAFDCTPQEAREEWQFHKNEQTCKNNRGYFYGLELLFYKKNNHFVIPKVIAIIHIFFLIR